MPAFRKRKFQPSISGGFRRQKRKTLSKKVNKLARIVKRAVETKNIDATSTGTITTAGSVVFLNGIAQGDSSSNRDGKEVSMRSVDLKTSFTAPSGTVISGGSHVRYILFVAKDNDGTQATVTDVLKAADWQEHYNLDNSHNIRILKDRTFTMPNGNVYDVSGTPTQQATRAYRRVFQSFKSGLRVRYKTTGNLVGDCEGNGLFLLMISNSGTATYDVQMRVRFQG